MIRETKPHAEARRRGGIQPFVEGMFHFQAPRLRVTTALNLAAFFPVLLNGILLPTS